MAASVPGSLQRFVVAGPDGWRLLFVPRLRALLLSSLGAGLAIPAVVTAPLVLFVVLPVAGFAGGFAVLWRTALVSLVLLLAAGVVVAGMTARVATTEVRWVDLCLARAPAVLVVRRGWRSRETPLSDLRSVTVVRRHRLDALLGVRVVLRTRAETITGDFGAVKRSGSGEPVDAAGLARWLADRLVSAGVDVEQETVNEPASLPVEAWWPATKVAEMWEVPVAHVAALAEEQGVRCASSLPRVGALHSPGRAATARYDPDDVCRLARERRGSGGQQQPATS